MSTPSDIRANGQHPTTSTPTPSNDPDAIRADIERTREDLAVLLTFDRFGRLLGR